MLADDRGDLDARRDILGRKNDLRVIGELRRDALFTEVIAIADEPRERNRFLSAFRKRLNPRRNWPHPRFLRRASARNERERDAVYLRVLGWEPLELDLLPR